MTSDQRQKTGDNPRFVAVDFFCGAGGTTRGLIDAGGYVIAGIDHDERCKQTYEENNKPARFLNYDIFEKTDNYPNGQQDELFEELGSLIKEKRIDGVPLLFAVCAPCQPFTSLSSDKKMSAERIDKRFRDKNLLSQALKFIDKFKPDAVLSENVAGISDSRYGNIWEDFKNKLVKRGYVVDSDVVCASKFGVPQHRKRSILLAVKKDFAGDKELKVKEENSDIDEVTVKQAIGHLPKLKAGQTNDDYDNHRTPKLSDKNLLRMKHAKPGKSNECLDDTPDGDLSLACHRRLNKKQKARGFSDVYTRMHPDRLAPTITTKCHSISNGRYGHYDQKQLRAISMREAAILQSFPDDYVFYPTDKIVPVAHMIGNAVPPKLAEFFANELMEIIENGS